MRLLWWSAAILSWITTTASADGLLDETYLHPMDGFTAQTLHAGEVVFAQPVSPFPGWAWLGLTDRLTVEIDLTPLLGGLFQEPYLPVPSENLRYRVFDGHRDLPSVAIEAMAQYLWRPYDQEDLDHLLVRRTHLGGFLHVNASVPIGAHSWIHASLGASYQRYYFLTNQRRTTTETATFRDLVDPDASISLDWRTARWITLHLTGSYGSTFVYSDNESRKWQLAYGMRIAPFLGQRWSILRDLRIELAALVIERYDIHELVAIYLPIYPYVYWQWQL